MLVAVCIPTFSLFLLSAASVGILASVPASNSAAPQSPAAGGALRDRDGKCGAVCIVKIVAIAFGATLSMMMLAWCAYILHKKRARFKLSDVITETPKHAEAVLDFLGMPRRPDSALVRKRNKKSKAGLGMKVTLGGTAMVDDVLQNEPEDSPQPLLSPVPVVIIRKASAEDSYAAALSSIQPVTAAPITADTPEARATAPLDSWTTNSFVQEDTALAGTLGVKIQDCGRTIVFSQSDEACIQSANSIPLAAGHDATYYFEMTVDDKQEKNSIIAIGLAMKPFPPFRLPGWDDNSVGVMSDTGQVLVNAPDEGMDYIESGFGRGDTIGCGYRPSTGLVFYTKNGVALGIAAAEFGLCEDVGRLYPTVGVDGPCELAVNFGSRPFVFTGDGDGAEHLAFSKVSM